MFALMLLYEITVEEFSSARKEGGLLAGLGVGLGLTNLRNSFQLKKVKEQK